MSDESLRAAERAMRAEPGPETVVGYLRACERAGKRGRLLDVVLVTYCFPVTLPGDAIGSPRRVKRKRQPFAIKKLATDHPWWCDRIFEARRKRGVRAARRETAPFDKNTSVRCDTLDDLGDVLRKRLVGLRP